MKRALRNLDRQKGVKGSNLWLPPNKNYQCEYVQKWTKLETQYELKKEDRGPASTTKLLEQVCSKSEPKNIEKPQFTQP